MEFRYLRDSFKSVYSSYSIFCLTLLCVFGPEVRLPLRLVTGPFAHLHNLVTILPLGARLWCYNGIFAQCKTSPTLDKLSPLRYISSSASQGSLHIHPWNGWNPRSVISDQLPSPIHGSGRGERNTLYADLCD